MMELAQVHRTQGKPAEAMALARSAMTAFKELHDTKGVVDAAEVVVYLMPNGEDHAPLRNEALAVVDAHGKPLACGVLHEWADDLFARGRGGEAFTKISEARECFHRRRRARPRGTVARQPRPRLSPARTPRRRACPVQGGAGAARVARVHRSRRRGPGHERHRRHAVDDGTLRRGRRAVRGRPRAGPADGAVDGPVLRRQPRRLQDRLRPAMPRRWRCSTKPSPRHPIRRTWRAASASAGARSPGSAGPSKRRRRSIAPWSSRRRRSADEVMAVRRSRARFLIDAGRFADAERDLRVLADTIEEGRAHTVPERRDAARLHRGAAGRVRRLHRSARPARRGRRGPRRRGTGPRPRLPRPPRRADRGHPAVDAGLHGRRPARRGAPAIDHPRLLGRPVGRLDLGGPAGSRAGAGPRAGPAVASHRAGAGDGGVRSLRERGPRPADDRSCPARAMARAGPAADRAGAPAPAAPRRAAG